MIHQALGNSDTASYIHIWKLMVCVPHQIHQQKGLLRQSALRKTGFVAMCVKPDYIGLHETDQLNPGTHVYTYLYLMHLPLPHT